LFIFVDNKDKSCLGVQAFLNDKTQENYKWVLKQILEATGFEPQVIISNMDFAMNAACRIVYKKSYYIYYIWHLS
jgi:hypothetical protein